MEVVESRQQPNRFARRLFTGLPDRYDRLAELLSLGQNRRWREAMVAAVEDGGSLDPASPAGTVLDVATGTAGVAVELLRRGASRVVGVDLTWAMLLEGRSRVRESGAAGRIALAAARAEELPFAEATFDALTFTYLLRYVADPAATVSELVRVVKPGGVVANLEFAVPASPIWRPLWFLYTRLVLPVAGYLTGGREWWAVGRFLGPSISAHYRRYPVEWHVRAWQEAGVEGVEVRKMSLGGGLVMWGRKAPAGA
ncbi:MAG TPA: class I SAM-dependent methyltransferase [Acidimicrobiales bacterium]|nr:class I SAM-dependent methyltransferase [Acidimicrobiales bacterium]